MSKQNTSTEADVMLYVYEIFLYIDSIEFVSDGISATIKEA